MTDPREALSAKLISAHHISGQLNLDKARIDLTLDELLMLAAALLLVEVAPPAEQCRKCNERYVSPDGHREPLYCWECIDDMADGIGIRLPSSPGAGTAPPATEARKCWDCGRLITDGEFDLCPMCDDTLRPEVAPSAGSGQPTPTDGTI